MASDLTYQKAQFSDIEQVAELTIRSLEDKDGLTFYERIFKLNRIEFASIVLELFHENIAHNEFQISCYSVLKNNDEIVACLASWKEGENDIESEKLLPMKVLRHVGIEKWMANNAIIQKSIEQNIARQKGKLQVENMFLKKEFRGTSAFFKIYFRTVDELFKRYAEDNVIQSRFFSNNALAIRIAKHIGYDIVKESSFDVEPLNTFFPNQGLVMTELNREIFYTLNQHKFRN